MCQWRIPTDEEMQIRAELRSGEIAFGILVSPTKRRVSVSDLTGTVEMRDGEPDFTTYQEGE